MEATSSAFQWLANSFYVLVALAVVYLYFFRIVPLVAGKVNLGSLGGVVQLSLILIVVAILIGFVAVRTADWIFINVLDSLPGTRIAEEIDRVTGPVVELPISESNGGLLNIPSATVNRTGPANNGSSAPAAASAPASSSVAASSAPAPSLVLKSNAMSIWAGRIQSIYNPTGRVNENSSEMSAADIPAGVTCRVFATQPSRLWRTRANEPWTLSCSNDEFSTTTNILVNGTAARGLTGGSFYDSGNKMPVYGAGAWPQEAIERTVAPETPGSNTQGSTQPASAPAAASGSVGGPVASAASADVTVENGQRFYTVKNGDSLARIAETYDVQVFQLVNANASRYPQMANDNNFIRAGWKLLLP